MPKIYDNISNLLSKGLNETLAVSSRTDFCVGYFNLRGWKQVADKIDVLSGAVVAEGDDSIHRTCRLLVGMQKMPGDMLREFFRPHDDLSLDNNEAAKLRRKVAEEFKEQLTIGTPTDADERALRRLSCQMKDGKVAVKLHLRYPLHAKLYLAYSDDFHVPVVGYLGSSNLTMAGLSKQGELNIDVLEQDAAQKLCDWFEARWNDRWCIDITQELIEIIDASWATEEPRHPYHIYLKMAYHLAREARAGISEFKLPKVFQRELLEFQQKAVLVAAHHLNKRDGVMIGDVVGLGKTITASALAKLFEDDFFLETLIICPKNLVEMWEDYRIKYQLRAKVLSITRVQKELPKLRRFRIVVIDESHNLRNHEGARYRAIKSYLEENESKVILLTATPYNKSYIDLSNQLRLFIPDDKDLGVTPENYIESIGGAVHFSSEHTDTFIRSIKAFERSEYADDWRELMRLYMVRRTRSFIKTNYSETDTNNGRKFLTFSDGSRSYFPDRTAKKVEYKFDPDDPSDQYAKLYSQTVVDFINQLELPRYGLGERLKDTPMVVPTTQEALTMANLSRAGKRLMGFCRTNLFKRLESSGFSFLLSISRHILRNSVFIYALQNRLPLPIGKSITQNLDGFLEDSDIDKDDDAANPFNWVLNEETYLSNAKNVYEFFETPANKKKYDWVRSELFLPTLETELIQDCRLLIEILKIGKDWNVENDRQLNALHDLLTKTYQNEKVLVFTQFADTARYLYKELKARSVDSLEWVSGDSESPTDIAHRFSPISNDKPQIAGTSSEIRVLISTDVLSEGQNLQDAHIVVNFDLPWAIIRLIQRAGRVDRIGQQAESIVCYSFLPEDGLERIINLRGRLKTRIQQNAEVVGSDETFFEGDPVNIQDLYNEKSGILDESGDDSEVDLASYAYQIWKNAIDADPELAKVVPDLPDVVYATKPNDQAPEKEGAIVYTRTSEDNDVLAWLDREGNVLTQSQYTILKAAQCQADTEALHRLENHHELVSKGVEFARQEDSMMGTSLGKKSGAKYRTYMRLDRYCKENDGTLFVTEALKKAVDDILNRPLTEFARETLNRQMKAGISDEQLGNLVVSLRDDDRLVIGDDGEKPVYDPKIICSMGLKN
jgi:superfamily II DNA or RNA helicase